MQDHLRQPGDAPEAPHQAGPARTAHRPCVASGPARRRAWHNTRIRSGSDAGGAAPAAATLRGRAPPTGGRPDPAARRAIRTWLWQEPPPPDRTKRGGPFSQPIPPLCARHRAANGSFLRPIAEIGATEAEPRFPGVKPVPQAGRSGSVWSATAMGHARWWAGNTGVRRSAVLRTISHRAASPGQDGIEDDGNRRRDILQSADRAAHAQFRHAWGARASRPDGRGLPSVASS